MATRSPNRVKFGFGSRVGWFGIRVDDFTQPESGFQLLPEARIRVISGSGPESGPYIKSKKKKLLKDEIWKLKYYLLVLASILLL